VKAKSEGQQRDARFMRCLASTGVNTPVTLVSRLEVHESAERSALATPTPAGRAENILESEPGHSGAYYRL
jgi:hypothetical protein